MRRTTKRFLYALAAMDFRTSELKELMDDLRDMSPSEVYDLLRGLEQRMSLEPYERDYELRMPRLRALNDSTLGNRVSRLLRDEARLSTADAVEKLSRELVKANLIVRSDLPRLSKKSFDEWVSRLAPHVSEREILRIATLIRNETVHSPNADWNLSRANK